MPASQFTSCSQPHAGLPPYRYSTRLIFRDSHDTPTSTTFDTDFSAPLQLSFLHIIFLNGHPTRRASASVVLERLLRLASCRFHDCMISTAPTAPRHLNAASLFHDTCSSCRHAWDLADEWMTIHGSIYEVRTGQGRATNFLHFASWDAQRPLLQVACYLMGNLSFHLQSIFWLHLGEVQFPAGKSDGDYSSSSPGLADSSWGRLCGQDFGHVAERIYVRVSASSCRSARGIDLKHQSSADITISDSMLARLLKGCPIVKRTGRSDKPYGQWKTFARHH